MGKPKMSKIFKKIAKQHGVSVEEVKSEIQKAIDIGLVTPSPAIQKNWENVPRKGETPTPEEVILHLSKQAKEMNR